MSRLASRSCESPPELGKGDIHADSFLRALTGSEVPTIFELPGHRRCEEQVGQLISAFGSFIDSLLVPNCTFISLLGQNSQRELRFY